VLADVLIDKCISAFAQCCPDNQNEQNICAASTLIPSVYSSYSWSLVAIRYRHGILQPSWSPRHIFAAKQYQHMDRFDFRGSQPVGVCPRPACTASTGDRALTHAKLHRIHHAANETVDNERVQATTECWNNGASDKVLKSKTGESDR
jgi:hypothetical protein